MIQESTLVARLGTPIEGTLAAKAAKLTGLVGGAGLYNLNVGDSVTVNEQTFEVRERVRDGQTIQSPVVKLSDNRVIAIGTIARRNSEGKFHPESTGMEILEKLQSAGEVVTALNGKTITVKGVREILMPVYGKAGVMAPVKQYAFEIK